MDNRGTRFQKMLLDKEIENIRALNNTTIEHFSKRIYRKMEIFLKDEKSPNLDYSKLHHTFLHPLVRSIPPAVEIQKHCSNVLSSSSDQYIFDEMENVHIILISYFTARLSTLLSFSETISLGMILSTMQLPLRVDDKNFTLPIIYNLDTTVKNTRVDLEKSFNRSDYKGMTSAIILSRLAGACNLFEQQINLLLVSKTKRTTYVAFCQIYALLIEMYARCFEFEFIYMSAQLYRK